jgi:ComEC/Rec2-related protein
MSAVNAMGAANTMGGMKKSTARERGSKDYRLVPVALALWGTVLVCSSISGSSIPWSIAAAAIIVTLVSFLGICVLRFRPMSSRSTSSRSTSNRSMSSCLPLFRSVLCHGAVIGAVVLIGISICSVRQSVLRENAIYQSAQEKNSVHVVGTVTSEPIASWKLGFECQFAMTTAAIESQSVLSSSSTQVLVFAHGNGCAVENGGEYRLDGKVSVAQFGTQPVWMDMGEATNRSVPKLIRSPTGVDSLFSRMSQSFTKVTGQLHGQASVLVPGLTIGVVGQDLLSQDQAIDDDFGASVENEFKNSGIMHLMAVSGGHFVLAAIIAKRLGGLLKLPRLLRSLLMLVAIFVLARMVYPSDSVTRAVLTGIIGAVALSIGRRSQAVSALCWCVIVVLLVNPAMAESFGFALSCAAVMGIIFIGLPLSKAISKRLAGGRGHFFRRCARVAAEGFAMSFGAQCATLPIQIAMTGQISMFSLLANMIVAPFVSMATILGLLSFLVSWMAPGLGFALAWASGLGTYVMYAAARFFGNPRFVVGIEGNTAPAALICAAVEIVVVIVVVVLVQFLFPPQIRGLE